ncbi:hypothetical protein VMF7928_02310 [Vibrio marisflavi CECT 7928]|uniref:Uncharacterized protein n=1 Tax=Vibrio marisflavi CECT 7928 TaxID=634439 RepID=A0ABM9A4J0_9VIBR|nr:hypothetical protein VMF7928_02310 [Vibrio marisflavi CECT 7928]
MIDWSTAGNSAAKRRLLKQYIFHSSVLLPESFTSIQKLAPSATDLTVLSRESSNCSPRFKY